MRIRLFCILAFLSHFMLFSYEYDLGFKNQDGQTYREFLDGKDALQWGNTWSEGSIFSKEEQEIIYEYTTGSSIFNNKLRRGDPFASLPKNEQEKIQKLDRALGKFIIFENIKVYRYENFQLLEKLYPKDIVYSGIYSGGKFLSTAEQYLEDIQTRIHIDRGFMSTTLIRNSVFNYRAIELVIKVEKYSDALFIARNGFSAIIQEYEMLFPRNRVLYFEKFEISKDRKKLTLYARMQGPYWAIKKERR